MTTKDKNKLKDILIDLGLDPKTPVDDLWKNSGDMMEKAMLLWTRWKCLTDLYFLGAEVLGMKEARRKRPGGKWFYLLDDKFHGWMCNALSSNGDKIFQPSYKMCVLIAGAFPCCINGTVVVDFIQKPSPIMKVSAMV